MRENEILSSTVNIQCLPKVFERHSSAFDVPARSSLSPGAVPLRFAGLGCFPQGEIQGVFLGFTYFNAGTSHHAIEGTMAELAVIRVAVNSKIDIASGLVGMP